MQKLTCRAAGRYTGKQTDWQVYKKHVQITELKNKEKQQPNMAARMNWQSVSGNGLAQYLHG